MAPWRFNPSPPWSLRGNTYIMKLLKTQISHDQRKKIFKLANLAGLSNDELHCCLPEWAGCNSLASANCFSFQADIIIKALENICRKKGVVINAPLPRGGDGVGSGKLTARQLNAINTIQSELGWDDKRLSGFIAHTTGRDTACIDDLSPAEASKVITGLKRMGYTKINCHSREGRNPERNCK